MPPKCINIMETNVTKYLVAQTNKGSNEIGCENGDGLTIEISGEKKRGNTISYK